MTLILLYVATAVIFLGLDALMLTLFMKPLFESHIKALMLESPRIVPAAIFYLAYVGGLIWLISFPALRAGLPLQALIGGAVLGAMAYGTYEFTNYAILRDWHVSMVVADVAWGTFATAVSAWGGVLIVRALLPA